MEVSRHLHQTAVFAAAARDSEGNPVMDARGRPNHGPAVTVACRKRYKLTEILTSEAQVIRGEWIYRLDTAVQVDDLLDGRRVQFTQEMVTPGGEIYGYKAVC